MTKLKFFRMEEDNVTVTFGSGVTLREAGEFLFQHGRALRKTPAYGGITIGGAIGTGAQFITIGTSRKDDGGGWSWTKISYF